MLVVFISNSPLAPIVETKATVKLIMVCVMGAVASHVVYLYETTQWSWFGLPMYNLA